MNFLTDEEEVAINRACEVPNTLWPLGYAVGLFKYLLREGAFDGEGGTTFAESEFEGGCQAVERDILEGRRFFREFDLPEPFRPLFKRLLLKVGGILVDADEFNGQRTAYYRRLEFERKRYDE